MTVCLHDVNYYVHQCVWTEWCINGGITAVIEGILEPLILTLICIPTVMNSRSKLVETTHASFSPPYLKSFY